MIHRSIPVDLPPNPPSTIINNHILARSYGENLIAFGEGGRPILNMDGYLIAPLEAFSPKQLSKVRKRVAKLRQAALKVAA